ncbi:carboxypeptidase-like regulatory domain-containing protein [Salinimicrobium sediminilitoris]|uniref:carboxypeptidase-like regulatory domain-containing protein n=1 Tax=Salinimicrobium sediminilitoris TaxID=2876715 RepID=UPI001E451287|nr:carboxypeptidase-like regulatory domain-containing protein [Salinimicrobium sediminilitoris]MCC8360540.1 carboxypeptidase-like regulatory domain-containing protein [Salinimicrobium sediminilitoris]
MKKSLTFILLLICSLSSMAQEKTLLQGKILTPEEEISAINIINLTSKTGTTNNASGEFEIEVEVNDTLLFSSVQYELREIVITNEVLKKAFLTVLLVEKIDELNEVSISDIDLSGNLATDIENIPTLTQADLGFPMSDRPRPTSIERKLKTASNLSTSSPQTPAGAKVSLDGILNSINGKTAMLQKAAANEDLSQAVDAGVAALPLSFFTDLGIPEDRIRDFVYFCAENRRFYTLLPEAKRFELVEFYQAKAPEFIKERL